VPPVRLLTLTSLFPNSRQPRHGIFVANRLRRLCDSGRVDSTILAPIPWFPGLYREASEVPATETVHGFNVAHPRFLNVPGIGMRLQPYLLARACIRHLNRTATGDRYDVVDAHYFYPDGVAAAAVAVELGLPLVVSARGSDINLIGTIPFARRRMLEAAERAQALIAVSEALAEKMKLVGMPADRLVVLRNGVDTVLFGPFPRDQARQRLGLNVAGPLVLGVGNLVPEKGFELLVRAIGKLPEAHLLIVGEGPNDGRLRSVADTVAARRVTFRRSMPQEQLRFAYASADVLCLPSLREGWPNVLLESLACGTPVVAAGVGGVPEIVRSATVGAIVGERTPDAWADAIRSQLRTERATHALREYATRFGWDDIVVKQCTLYEDVVSLHQSSSSMVAPVPPPPRHRTYDASSV
jgi:teichuronic acid biosynthesis glycosyltransferase TuaC